jgi:hypothetical protein
MKRHCTLSVARLVEDVNEQRGRPDPGICISILRKGA